ncbi:MAG: RNA 3'-terminal phosphate cyclase [Theionarchaea archaeon]|nr:RNA 3'-terminal phosphate cyclase [Theionarchaea archaeon]
MPTIDGSYMEGGGQILRTSVALSALTGLPCRITHIRANRPTPGLKAQHLMGLKAAALICHAETKGMQIGSTEVEFSPQKIHGGDYTIEVGTAGSVTLVLQVLTPLCLYADSTVTLTVTGGTDVKWSPSASYFKNVFCFLLKKMNANIEFTVKKYGFYPKGGGCILAVIHPWKDRKSLFLTERGPVQKVDVDSVASSLLKKAKVAERQSEAFQRVLSGDPGTVRNNYVDSFNPGSSFCAHAYCEHTILGADSLGERGKPAEKVGEEAAYVLKREIESQGALDSHMADQIIPYLALAGGRVSVSHVSEHTRTNIWVCQQFLDTKISVSGNIITADSD